MILSIKLVFIGSIGPSSIRKHQNWVSMGYCVSKMPFFAQTIYFRAIWGSENLDFEAVMVF